MKILQSTGIDPLYRKYSIHRSQGRYGQIQIDIAKNGKPLYNEVVPTISALKDDRESLLYIQSLQGKGVGHELMILLLCEAYYERVKYITLAVKTENPDIISQENLVDFYRRFGFDFTDTLIEKGFDCKPYPMYSNHMTLFTWDGLVQQVKKYVDSVQLGSKLK